LIPWIFQLDELNRRFLPMKQIRTVLTDELGPDYKFQDDKFLNGRVEFDCLAGAHLASRKIMAQAMPLITQIFDNPAIQSQLNEIGEEYVDIKEMLLMWLESTGWRNRKSLIKKMTPEQKQRQKEKQQEAAGASKVAGQIAVGHARSQDQAQLLDQKGEQGIVRDMISKSFDQGGDALLRQAEEKAPAMLGAEGE
jgi:hypothetical protein